jgi:hypothetical protein
MTPEQMGLADVFFGESDPGTREQVVIRHFPMSPGNLVWLAGVLCILALTIVASVRSTRAGGGWFVPAACGAVGILTSPLWMAIALAILRGTYSISPPLVAVPVVALIGGSWKYLRDRADGRELVETSARSGCAVFVIWLGAIGVAGVVLALLPTAGVRPSPLIEGILGVGVVAFTAAGLAYYVRTAEPRLAGGRDAWVVSGALAGAALGALVMLL